MMPHRISHEVPPLPYENAYSVLISFANNHDFTLIYVLVAPMYEAEPTNLFSTQVHRECCTPRIEGFV